MKTLALDPSKGSDSRRGDYSALVMLGVDRQGMLYVEADWRGGRRRRSWPTASSSAAASAPTCSASRRTSSRTCSAGEFEAEFRRQGVLGARPWPLENRVNKLVRIRRLGPYLSARRLRFKSNSRRARGCWSSNCGSFPSATTTTAPTPRKWPFAWRPSCSKAAGGRRRQPQRIPVG